MLLSIILLIIAKDPSLIIIASRYHLWLLPPTVINSDEFLVIISGHSRLPQSSAASTLTRTI